MVLHPAAAIAILMEVDIAGRVHGDEKPTSKAADVDTIHN